MANLFEPEFDDESSRPGFSWKRARLGRQAGGERLGASLYELSVYPDSNKILAGTRPPGGEEGDDDIFDAFDLADVADYWEAEEPPAGRP
jgi:hypothetical protein